MTSIWKKTKNILLVMLLGAVFGAMLGFIQQTVESQVVAKYSLELQRSILYAVNIDASAAEETEVNRMFREHFKESQTNGFEYLTFLEQGETVGYCFPFMGKGMWGGISGYLAVDQQADRTLGVVFTEHTETPGLGARIEEKEFTDQFRDIDITGSDTPIQMNGKDSGGIDNISGATFTVEAVIESLNEALGEIRSIVKEVQR